MTLMIDGALVTDACLEDSDTDAWNAWRDRRHRRLIAYANDAGLRDYRPCAIGPGPVPRRRWPWLVVLFVVSVLSLVGCASRRVVVLIPDPIRHDIGLWADDDLICVAPPTFQQLYVQRRCVPMRTIRAVILQTQFAIHQARF